MPKKIGLLMAIAMLGAACGSDSATTTVVDSTLPPAVTTSSMAATTTTTAAPTAPATTAPSATTTTAEGGTISASADCLVGTWNPEQTELEDFLLTLYRPYAADASLDGGTIDLVLGADGSFAQNYNGVMGSGTAGGTTVTMEFTGGSFGTYEVSGDQITINFEGSDIGAVVNGASATAPSIPAASVSATILCEGDELTVQPPPEIPANLWPLPQHWRRAS